MRKAIIDVGSNSVLLVVAELREGAWHTLAERTRVTALGNGTKRTGELSETSMTDTLGALREFFEFAHTLGARVQAGATMAARIARNTPEFLDRAEAQNTPVTVVSADDEAHLGLLAVLEDPLFAGEDRLTIIDPGGNSTEVATYSRADQQMQLKRSIPVGALGLRDEFDASGPLSPRTIMAMTAALDREIGMEYLPHQCGKVVTLGATGTNLVSIREKFAQWEPELVHGQVLDYEEISKAAGWLANMTDAERAAIPGIEKGRERTIHIGSLILERFLFAVHGLECVVSVRGWRHAALTHGLSLSQELSRS